ncbi:MAG TPA: YetF domain-containing protein [Tepidisphaeraceae bacterium]|nr:YetF domain-containing protein [Tepidisphaeraceae bacterium]
MFLDSWHGLLRVLVVGTTAYFGLIVLLRASGKRTLSKLNAFDLVVTVALGSTLATVLLSKDVALTEGMLALGLLIGLQFGVTWISVRVPAFHRGLTAAPTLLYFRGQFLADAMRRERVTRDELLNAVRRQGVGAMDQVEAIILESAADVTVIKKTGDNPPTALADVPGAGVPS